MKHTIATWQPLAAGRLNKNDVREILKNVIGFFELLHKWDLSERQHGQTTEQFLSADRNGDATED